MKIFLVRHGESTGDIERRYGGDYDDHLTDRGRRQTKKLVIRLSRKGIQKIFSSPRLRAKETAEILSKDLDRELEVVNDLRERNFYGILTGMKKSTAKKKYPDEIKKLKSYKNTIEGAEDYGSFKKRVIEAFSNIAASDLRFVAVVTHGGPISCFFREVLKKGEFKNIDDCAFFEIEYDGKFKLIEMSGAEL